MAHNVKKLCMNCGRMFIARDSKHAFCSIECKKMYANHSGYRCRDCRNASCKLRNNDLFNSPPDCPNLKIHASFRSEKKQ